MALPLLLRPFAGGHSLEYLPTSHTKATATSLRGFMEFVPFPHFFFLVPGSLRIGCSSFVA